MLFRVRLFDVGLSHLLHHKVGINIYFLDQHATSDAPFAGDGEHTNGRLSIDKGVDTFANIGEGKLVCGLADKISVINFARLYKSRDLPDQLASDR
jgi:hypothetical protein